MVVGLDAEGDVDLPDLDVEGTGVCLVVGSEGEGLSRLVRDLCDTVVSIPMGAGHRVAQRRGRRRDRAVRGGPAALSCWVVGPGRGRGSKRGAGTATGADPVPRRPHASGRTRSRLPQVTIGMGSVSSPPSTAFSSRRLGAGRPGSCARPRRGRRRGRHARTGTSGAAAPRGTPRPAPACRAGCGGTARTTGSNTVDQPGVGDDLLVLALHVVGGGEGVHVVEQAAGLVLLDVQAGQPDAAAGCGARRRRPWAGCAARCR